jgi:hypothetical protein
MAIGVTTCSLQDSGSARATIDRETVDCLTSELTRDEKLRIAQVTDEHNVEATRSAYGDVFSRCVVRFDQVERQDILIGVARQALNQDQEFKRMLIAPRLISAQR